MCSFSHCRLTKLSPSSRTHASTRSQTGSWTDKRISLMANTSNWPPPIWTRNCVKIWSVWRRSVPIVVCVTTGVSVSVVNTPRQPAVVDAPLVCRRRSRAENSYQKIIFGGFFVVFFRGECSDTYIFYRATAKPTCNNSLFIANSVFVIFWMNKTLWKSRKKGSWMKTNSVFLSIKLMSLA